MQKKEGNEYREGMLNCGEFVRTEQGSYQIDPRLLLQARDLQSKQTCAYSLKESQ